MFDLCDTWKLINPKTKKCTFRRNQTNGFIQRRFDNIFISSSFQFCVKSKFNLTAISTDHSPFFIP